MRFTRDPKAEPYESPLSSIRAELSLDLLLGGTVRHNDTPTHLTPSRLPLRVPRS